MSVGERVAMACLCAAILTGVGLGAWIDVVVGRL